MTKNEGFAKSIFRDNPEFEKALDEFARNEINLTDIARRFDVTRQWVHKFLNRHYTKRDIFTEKKIRTEEVMEQAYLEEYYVDEDFPVEHFIEKYPHHFKSDQMFWRATREGDLVPAYREDEYYDLGVSEKEVREKFTTHVIKQLKESGYEAFFKEGSYELKWDALRPFSLEMKQDLLRLGVFTHHAFRQLVSRTIVDIAKENNLLPDVKWTTEEEPDKLPIGVDSQFIENKESE